jgi:tRNA A37 methylthiotransferase MiaB
MKLLFYHAVEPESYTNRVFLGVASLYLKTFIDIHDPDLAGTLHWMLPQQRRMTDDELIKLINEKKPDIFCTSHYIWNHKFLLDQLSRIKSRLDPNIKIIAGGPSVSVNIEQDFFEKYPFIDYAIYGAGEQAFYDILKSIQQNKKIIAFNTSNCAWYDTPRQTQITADYKYVPIPSISHYTHNEQMFREMVDKERADGYDVGIPYELTRGCPYSCTFCDWNSGLGNKVSRRRGTYKNEIDLFAELKVYHLFLSDANVGQYDEDIDVIAYFAEKNIKENCNFKLMGNFSKLKKQNNLKIFHLMANGKLIISGFNMSVQDIDKTVLDNIDRPDITWEEHIKIIDELNQAYPHYHTKTQLIQGLPGQTVASWKKTLATITRKKILPIVFMNELLPASPASLNKNYHDKFKFEYDSTSTRYSTRTVSPFFTGTFPVSCVSFSRDDMVEMTILTGIYTTLAVLKIALDEVNFDLDQIVESFYKTSNYQLIKENLSTNWSQGNFYYTCGFEGNKNFISACSPNEIAHDWLLNQSFMNLILKNTFDTSLKKKVFLSYKDKVINRLIIDILNDYS